jgi:hypothetical protein
MIEDNPGHPEYRTDIAADIFCPYFNDRQKEAEQGCRRFVHYTNAEAAVSMIVNKEVWMRKPSVTNDFMEIEHGLNCLVNSYHNETGRRLRTILEGMFPDLCQQLESRFNVFASRLKYDTYITCISEHLDEEDKHGRLSMWRAYGSPTGVAVVLNNTAMLSTSDALAAYSSPVAYLSETGFHGEFERVVNNIEHNTHLLRTWGREALLRNIFNAFRLMVLCTKHPGFYEEREWRIIYSPTVESSPRVLREIRTIRGVPQAIYKLPLEDIPDEGLVGAEIPRLVNRVIIGPTEHPVAIYEAFVVLLEDAGVENPASKVCISDIPLRY